MRWLERRVEDTGGAGGGFYSTTRRALFLFPFSYSSFYERKNVSAIGEIKGGRVSINCAGTHRSFVRANISACISPLSGVKGNCNLFTGRLSRNRLVSIAIKKLIISRIG